MTMRRRMFMAGIGGAAAAIPLMTACSRDDGENGARKVPRRPPQEPKAIIPEPLTGHALAS